MNLATIKMNSEHDTGVQEALLLIKSALRIQHGAEVNLDPRLLSHASEIFYYGGEVQRAESLALSAVGEPRKLAPPTQQDADQGASEIMLIRQRLQVCERVRRLLAILGFN